MSFDLYFAETQNEDCESFLLSSNSCRLQSQVNDRKNISRWCSEESHGKLFIDSGAYTVYTRGIELDVNAYIDYINSIDEHLTIFAQVDNIPGNGYETQYAAHVYEWGYDELKEKLDELGFEIINEVGLVMKVKKMKEFFSSDKVSSDMKDFYNKMSLYMPSAWLSSIVSIPYPKESDEILFVVKKKSKKLF